MITVNGEPEAARAGDTVADVLARLDVPAGRRGVAVAVDGEVVPRSAWAQRALRDGEEVEVLSAMQGG